MILCKNNDCVIANACLRNQEYLKYTEKGKSEYEIPEEGIQIALFESTDEGECNYYIEHIE
jgi:hypothetical protein